METKPNVIQFVSCCLQSAVKREELKTRPALVWSVHHVIIKISAAAAAIMSDIYVHVYTYQK